MKFLFFLSIGPLYGRSHENECFVTIIGNRSVGTGCKFKGSTCDFQIGKYTVCCCNTSNCNDDAFVEECKSGVIPTSIPDEGFSCLNSVNHMSSGEASQECSGMYNFIIEKKGCSKYARKTTNSILNS